MKLRRLFPFAITFCILLVTVSCKNNDGPLQFEELNDLEVFPTIQWAVIKNPYVACYKEAGYESVIISNLRKGDLVQIEGNCTVQVDSKKRETWYAVSGGWIPSSAMTIYNSYRCALSVQKQIYAEENKK